MTVRTTSHHAAVFRNVVVNAIEHPGGVPTLDVEVAAGDLVEHEGGPGIPDEAKVGAYNSRIPRGA